MANKLRPRLYFKLPRLPHIVVVTTMALLCALCRAQKRDEFYRVVGQSEYTDTADHNSGVRALAWFVLPLLLRGPERLCDLVT